MPQQNSSSNTSGTQNSRMVQCSGDRVTSMTSRIAAMLKLMVTKLEATRLSGKMNLGI